MGRPLGLEFALRVQSRLGALRWAAMAGVLLVALIVGIQGYGSGLEQTLRDMRDGLRERPASGVVHIIEIDAESIARSRAWPWPRTAYAQLLDRLGAAGVESVAFDIDFSTPSRAQDDMAFAQAIERFEGTVLLPTFRQQAGSGNRSMVEVLPIPALRPKAFLASVNVHADADGVIRRYSYGTRTAGVPRPSIAALLAGAAGRVERQFVIDQAIDPASIPRHSFQAIVAGRIDHSGLKGARVIVGGTAIELGDRYAVPRHGVLPGVVVQAQAAETLLAGTAMADWPFELALILALAVVLACQRARSARVRNALLIVTASFVLALPMVCEMMGRGSPHIVPALFLLAAVGLLFIGFDLLGEIGKTQRQDVRSGLPNGLALCEAMGEEGPRAVIAARFPHMSELVAMLSEQERSQLHRRIADRLALCSGASAIYLEGSEVFAWLSSPWESDISLSEQFSALARIFRSPMDANGRPLLLTPHFGFAAGTEERAATLLARAGRAASQAGARDAVWLRDDEVLAAHLEDDHALLAELDQAMRGRQFWLAFQPQLHLRENRVASAEVLLRWKHPERGEISPGRFIPLFERHGRMRELTLHTVARAIDQARSWKVAGCEMSLALNISGTLLLDRDFLESLESLLIEDSDLLALLTLEVTETAAIAETKAAVAALERLSAMGVRISIDDYGTGQSTLSYLKQFPVDEIKLDQSFVTGMSESDGDQILVRSTIELAGQLGFQIVAEGVEDERCLAMLREMGCDIAQGWHIGKPVDAASFERLFMSQRAAA